MEQSPKEDRLLKQLEGIVLENLRNEEFGVEDLARESGMSRTNLYRKIKKGTGKSGTEFIRDIRLKEAFKLLQQDEKTASEVAYEVGFNSPTYFNSCFKSYFGFTPGDARNHSAVLASASPKSTFRNNRKYLWIGLLSLLFVSLLVYSLVRSESPEEAGSSSGNVTEKSIAILPFENLSPDSEHDYFIRGLQEELLVYLSGLQDVMIKAPEALSGPLSSGKTLAKIADELSVTHLLSGSFQYHDEEMRVIIKLIDPSSNDQLWNMTYDGKLEDIFEVQSSISRQVALALNSQFRDSLSTAVNGRRTENIEAYKAYLRGRDLWYVRKEENMRKSILQFEEAIRLDPEYAVAYAGLADTYAMMAWWDFMPKKEGYERALELAQKSIALEPNNPEPHATLAVIYTYYALNWDLAFNEFEAALRLNPNYDTAMAWYAELLQIFNRSNEAMQFIDKAIELNPTSIIWEITSMGILYDSERYAEVLEKIENQAKRIDRGWHDHMWFKCYANLQRADSLERYLNDKGILIDRENRDLESPYALEDMVRAYAYWLEQGGKEKEWEPSSWDMVTLYAIVQDTAKVLDYLEKYYYHEKGNIYYIRSADYLEFLKEEPRYRAILDSLNLNDNVYLRYSK